MNRMLERSLGNEVAILLRMAIRIAATGFRPGLPGHRKAIERLPQEGRIAIGEGRPVFSIILDIDQFKSIHGTCGPCGGEMLRPYDRSKLAQCCP